MMQCPVTACEIRSHNESLGTLLKIVLLAIPSSVCGPIWLMTTCSARRYSGKCSLFPLLLPVIWALAVRTPMIFFVYCRFRTFRPGGNRPNTVFEDLMWCWDQLKYSVAQQVPSILLTITVMLEETVLHYGERWNWLDFSVFAWMLSTDILALSKATIVMLAMREHFSQVKRFLQDMPAWEQQQQLMKLEDMCKQLASFEYQERKLNCKAQICSGETCDLRLHETLHVLPWFNDQVTCTVCLSDFSQNDVVLHPSCGHLFHGTCFSKWMCARLKGNMDEFQDLAPMCPFGCSLERQGTAQTPENCNHLVVTIGNIHECDDHSSREASGSTVQQAVIASLDGSFDASIQRI